MTRGRSAGKPSAEKRGREVTHPSRPCECCRTGRSRACERMRSVRRAHRKKRKRTRRISAQEGREKTERGRLSASRHERNLAQRKRWATHGTTAARTTPPAACAGTRLRPSARLRDHTPAPSAAQSWRTTRRGRAEPLEVLHARTSMKSAPGIVGGRERRDIRTRTHRRRACAHH